MSLTASTPTTEENRDLDQNDSLSIKRKRKIDERYKNEIRRSHVISTSSGGG
jgi:hypothetical protein